MQLPLQLCTPLPPRWHSDYVGQSRAGAGPEAGRSVLEHESQLASLTTDP